LGRIDGTVTTPGFHSLTTRLIFWILVLVGGITGLTLVLSSRVSRQAAVLAAEREAVRATEAAVNEAEDVLGSVERGTRVLAATLESAPLSDAQLEGLLRRFVAISGNVYGSAAAFEPRAFDPGRARFAPYVHRVSSVDSVELARADLATDAYRYWEHDWYFRPLLAREPSWSEPYFDEGGGNVVMVTYSVPVFGGPAGEGARGVVTADLQLDWLAELVRKFRVGRSGYAVLLSREGRLLAHPDLPRVGVTLAEDLEPGIRRRTVPIVQRMMSGRKGFEPIVLDGREYRLTYAPMRSTGWSLAALYPEDELMAGAQRLARVQGAVGVAGLAILAVAVVILSRRLTAPLRELAGQAHQLAAGDLDVAIAAPRSRDELGELTAAFSNMRDSLKARIRELQEATALRERLESELRIARRIQMGLLPESEGGGPGEGYAFSACLVPARAIGGDLYDQFVRDGKLYFLAADVSGKGIPAALFMARAKTLFEAVAADETEPAVILDRVNRGLLRENEEGMFVTGICGVLDVASGDLALAVAGHDPPFLAGAGPPAPLKVEGGPVMGLMHHAAFPKNRLRLKPGEQVVVFTDGVPEARDESESFFGPERLGQAVARSSAGGAKAVTTGLLESVRAFAGGAPQADDITIFTLQYRPDLSRPSRPA
jgi:sigma-B regulation protein RsbU (phosphoserine phosphatase)